MDNPAASSRGARGGDGVHAASVQNVLLAQLGPDDLTELVAIGSLVSLRRHEELFEYGSPIERAWFPVSGMISLVTVLKDGTFLEAMTVGREGFVGLPLINGVETHQAKGVCQIEGDFIEVEASAYLELVERMPALNTILRRYAQFAHEVVTQSAACNGVHLVEQRCARWLLSTADAVGKTSFNLTQELLAQMLAVRRAGVTVAIGALEKKALISHRYGNVTILDRAGLASAACECYATVKDKARALINA